MRVGIKIVVDYDESTLTCSQEKLEQAVKRSVEEHIGNGMMASDFDDSIVIDEWYVENLGFFKL